MVADLTRSAAGKATAAEAAVAHLHATYYKKLVRTAGWMSAWTGALMSQDAEDTAQEAFLSYLLAVRENPDAIEAPEGWLRTVARRIHLNRTYSAKRRVEFLARENSNGLFQAGVFGTGSPPADFYAGGGSEAHALLADAAAHYPEGAKYLFLIAEGFSAEEIANMCDTTKRRVQYQLQRVRRHIRNDRAREAEDYVQVNRPRQAPRLPRTNRDVDRLVRSLPAKQRMTLQMAVNGDGPSKIARNTDMTPGAVRGNLFQARAKIANALGIRHEDVLPFLRQTIQPIRRAA